MSRTVSLGVRLVGAGLIVAMLAITSGVAPQSAQARTSDAADALQGDALDAPSSRAEGSDCEMPQSGEYDKADPEAVGLDEKKLQEALNYASTQGSSTIKVFREDCLAGEGLRDRAFERTPTNNFGQTKAVTAMITGIAQDEGYVDIDEPIGTYLPPDLGDKKHRDVTLRQLLQASSGVQNQEVRGLNFQADQSRAREWFELPIENKPGTYFQYDQTAPSVIVFVIQEALSEQEPGVDFVEFAQRELFDPLGIPESAYFWQRDRSGTPTGYSNLYLRPLEFGRLGELMNNDGVYAGQRVISEQYMSELRSPAPTNCGYGYLVFLNSCQPGEEQVTVPVPERREVGGKPWIASAPEDMFFTDGVGIRTWVIPSLDMVITRSGVQELDTIPAASRGDANNVVPGQPGGPGPHKFFRLLMDAVINMPDDVRASIDNSGPYDRESEASFDAGQFLFPVDQGPGTNSIGPGAPEGCNPLGCEGASNDGYREYLGDAPRTLPGTVGAEERPGGD